MVLGLKNRTLHGVAEELAAIRGKRTFLYYEDETYTYHQINVVACQVACGLQALGMKKGDKAAIMMSNRPEFLFAWFGASKVGVIEVPINTAHKGEMLSYLLNQSDAKVLIVEAAFLPQLKSVAAEIPQLQHVIVLDDGGVELPGAFQTHHWTEITKNSGSYKPVVVRQGDAAAMMFTSGTTGPSKGAVMPQNYQLVMAEIVCAMAGYDERDRLYNALPLFHGNAQTLSTIPALISGASMVLAKRFSASQFWLDVRHYGCTEFNYIGGILPILLKADERPDDLDHPIRIMVGAGASKAVYEAFEERFGVTLIESYGMSEIGIPLISAPHERRPGSCGKRNPQYDLRLVDDNGLEVDIDTPGELLIRPLNPNAMMLEYYRMPEKTVEAWRDLWFHTGDYLQRDKDGFYYFVDRKKDALRRRGENISSFEVERCVNAHPAVMESAAIVAKSDLGEDEVMICVVVRDNARLSAAELVEYCQERMAYFMVPRYVRFMAALPKTPTERVQKYKLRQDGVTPDTFDGKTLSQKRRAS